VGSASPSLPNGKPARGGLGHLLAHVHGGAPRDSVLGGSRDLGPDRGYAQGLPVWNQFWQGIGPGIGPDHLIGLETAYFPPAEGETVGVGVSYLPTRSSVLLENPNTMGVLSFTVSS